MCKLILSVFHLTVLYCANIFLSQHDRSWSLYVLSDDVGSQSRPVFPWHSLLPFLHITPARRTPPDTEFDDRNGNFSTYDFVPNHLYSVASVLNL